MRNSTIGKYQTDTVWTGRLDTLSFSNDDFQSFSLSHHVSVDRFLIILGDADPKLNQKYLLLTFEYT